MAKLVGADLDFGGVSRISNLPNATAAQEPATKAQLDAVIQGLAWKDNVRAASTGNVNVSSAPSSIDGVTLTTGDRVLLLNQTTAAQNGIYLFPGSGNAMTRASDADTFDKLESAVVGVDEGSNYAGTNWRQTQVNGTLGSNDVTFVTFNAGAASASETVAGVAEIATAAETNAGSDDARMVTPAKLAGFTARIKAYSALIGDGMETQIDVSHNLGSQNVIVQVRAAANGAEVIAENRPTSDNVVRFNFMEAPTSNEFRVIILAMLPIA